MENNLGKVAAKKAKHTSSDSTVVFWMSLSKVSKNLTPQKEHKSKTLFRMCMIFRKITCLQSHHHKFWLRTYPPFFCFPYSLCSGNLHSERMWLFLNLRHWKFPWDVPARNSMMVHGIQGIDDELGNEIFDILEEHVSCLTWHHCTTFFLLLTVWFRNVFFFVCFWFGL